ncbi:peroxide stress protein YaaA [Ligilactobacillus sp. WILCCON 0076]|uniref:UPF0246 protein LB941_02260 n=1 Tax=Ligilactobacillus ubinensis TaxID=2876789 RepID=A0A9X2FKR6_9LACO|nr:peroxide stress protein YaaA [Ligilactobacillus ubinensis]MCP0886158.1 peroxide stress protein YaaA [Ligilactobacillus ubinensis]
MRIIISPAKKMVDATDDFASQSLPNYLANTEQILQYLQALSFDQIKRIWKCNDKLAQLNYARIQNMDLTQNLTPAIFSYEGIQYQSMAPDVFTQKQLDYISEHLRILSGFYGILRPFDGIKPYRLEMQAKVQINRSKNLYNFWGRKLYNELFTANKLVVNLASKEYSKAITPYLKPEDEFITCVFGVWKANKVVVRATEAKKIRGDMVSFMAKNQIEKSEELKGYTGCNYHFVKQLSQLDKYVFLRDYQD